LRKNASKSRASRANAIAKLEAEKKPLLQKRNQAKSTAEVCERELASVERRVQESEAADRDLLKQLSDLHALDPAPPDLEALSAGIMAKRARLPDERAELVRARLGSADAVRTAKEKLNTLKPNLPPWKKTWRACGASLKRATTNWLRALRSSNKQRATRAHGIRPSKNEKIRRI
jgi:chromosome segregation ATPase